MQGQGAVATLLARCEGLLRLGLSGRTRLMFAPYRDSFLASARLRPRSLTCTDFVLLRTQNPRPDIDY
jgi:hypothetical protein